MSPKIGRLSETSSRVGAGAPGDREVEFVSDSEVLGLLKEHGIVPDPAEGDEHVYLRMAPDREAVREAIATLDIR